MFFLHCCHYNIDFQLMDDGKGAENIEAILAGRKMFILLLQFIS